MKKMERAWIGVEYTIGPEEFKQFIGRKPKNKGELEMYANCISEEIEEMVETFDNLCEKAKDRFERELEMEEE